MAGDGDEGRDGQCVAINQYRPAVSTISMVRLMLAVANNQGANLYECSSLYWARKREQRSVGGG